MKTSLFVTLALALALTGCNKSTRSADANENANRTDTAVATTNNTASGTTTANSIENDLRSAANSAGNAMSSAASSVATTARIAEWKLSANDINADLVAGREIVRTKDNAAGAPTGTSDKSTIKSMVQSRLQADSSIAALKLDVNASRQGEIELEGKAQTADQVGRAIALALDTEGVNKVTSKIKVDKDNLTNR